jgi:hypothetical protein
MPSLMAETRPAMPRAMLPDMSNAPATTTDRSPEALRVEAEARAWVRGTGVDTIESTRLQLLKRGGTITRTEWETIVERVIEDYIGPAGLQRAFVHSAIVRILATAADLLDAEEVEPHHRVAAGRLALEASKQLAALVGVQEPERVEVSVTVDHTTAAERMAALLAKVDATIIEARAVEVAGAIDVE